MRPTEYGPPAPGIALATLAGLLFAAPVNLAAGNLLSIYSPKKLDYSTFGRQRASQTTVLVSLLAQRTTLSDGTLDTGGVDLGYHYPGPAASPPWSVHAISLLTCMQSKAPPGDDRTQHRTQGFGEQLPGPALSPSWVLH